MPRRRRSRVRDDLPPLSGRELANGNLRVTLTTGDAALVVRPNGISELHRHNYEPDEEIPFHVHVLTAIALRLAQDPHFVRDQLAWYDSRRREMATEHATRN